MKRVLKIELRKAFKSWYFAAALAIGSIFVLFSAYYQINLYYSDVGFMQMIDEVEEMGYVKYPVAPMSILYNSWIGGESVSLGFSLFFTLIPLLAVLPYGWSFSEEKRSGYIKVIVPRCGRIHYFSAKFIATFLSGGVAIVGPLILSLLVCSFVFPAVKPDVIYDMYYSLHHGSMLSALGYEHPMIHVAIYLCIDFVFSGLFACISISVSFFFKQRLAPLVVPFLILMGADLMRTLFLYISYVEVSPLLLMHPIPVANSTKAIVMLGWFFFFSIITIFVVFWKGKRYEIL